MHGKSKKAFVKNIKTEIAHGKPQPQALAIAYSVKRKAAKKASGGSVKSGSKDMDLNKGGMYAEGGMSYKNDSAKTESRPMPDERDNDSEMVSRNSGKKAPKDDQWTDTPTERQAVANNGRMVKIIKRPKMVPTDAFSTRMYDEESNLEESASPGRYDEQPPEHDNEEGPNRQGPRVRDMEDEHSTHRKPYAKGGEVRDTSDSHLSDYISKNVHLSKEEHSAKAKDLRSQTGSPKYQESMSKLADFHEKEASGKSKYARGGQIEASDEEIHADGRYEDDLLDLPPSEDEGAMMAREEDEEGQDRQGPEHREEAPHSLHSRMQRDNEANEDHEMELNPAHDKHSADDSEDQPEEEEHIDHAASVAAAIMAKRERKAMQHSDSDIDEEMHMAEGGEINEHDDADDIHSKHSIDSDSHSSQVDLSRNADEDANEEDQTSYNALRKENYSETPGLDALDSPEDSNLHGDEEESESENKHDNKLVSAIRRKMMKKSAISR